jgi:hypothetical protein
LAWKTAFLYAKTSTKRRIHQLLETEEIKMEDVEGAKDLVVEVDVHARNRIMYQVKQKIQSNLLDEALNLLKLLEKYFLTDIYIFFHVLKIPFIKKNYVEVKHWREQYIHIPDDQIRKRKNTNQKILLMFNIEMESYNMEFKKWNRKLFVLGRAKKLLIHLQTAQSLIGENRFSEALRTANEIWEKI